MGIFICPICDEALGLGPHTADHVCDSKRIEKHIKRLKAEAGMKCFLCEKSLELVRGNPYQPYGGGEVQFIFSYGSAKFDLNLAGTLFRACICDDCAEPLVKRMERVR